MSPIREGDRVRWRDGRVERAGVVLEIVETKRLGQRVRVLVAQGDGAYETYRDVGQCEVIA